MATDYISVNDRLFDLEGRLDRDAAPGTASWAQNRRIILRKALEAVEEQGRRQGYQNGLRDASEARHSEQAWAERQEARDA